MGSTLRLDTALHYADKVYRRVAAINNANIPGCVACSAPMRSLSQGQGEGKEGKYIEVYLDMRKIVDGSSEQALEFLASMNLPATFVGDTALYSAPDALRLDVDGAWRMAGWWKEFCHQVVFFSP